MKDLLLESPHEIIRRSHKEMPWCDVRKAAFAIAEFEIHKGGGWRWAALPAMIALRKLAKKTGRGHLEIRTHCSNNPDDWGLIQC